MANTDVSDTKGFLKISHATAALLAVMMVGWAIPWRSAAQTNAEPDLVSFSFDEVSSLNYVPNQRPQYTQDTIFAPQNNWFPLVRFVGKGAFSDVETDALSYGHNSDIDSFDVFFSVSLGAQGAAGTGVFQEQPPGDRYADIFLSKTMGDNLQIYDGDGSSAQILGVLENASTDVDGLDMRASAPKGLIYWSVSKHTAENANPYKAEASSGADIFLGQAVDGYSAVSPLTVYAQAWDLGLTGSDDVDAVVVFDLQSDGEFDSNVDIVFYSLVDGSVSLVAAGVPPFAGASAADVFAVGGGLAGPVIWASAAELGLIQADDLDALDLADSEQVLIALPEPSAMSLLGWGGAFLAVAHGLLRRRCRSATRRN